MSRLPSPATGVELYLDAIHEVLCEIRTALVGGGQAVPATEPTPAPEAPTTPASETPTKRTRTRTRGAAT